MVLIKSCFAIFLPKLCALKLRDRNVVAHSIFQYNVKYVRILVLSDHKSSHQRCSITKGVLRNFTIFTGKHLCQNLFFNKFVGLRHATCEISNNCFFIEHRLATASLTIVFGIKTDSVFIRENSG